MIKGSIQEEDKATTNIHAPNIGAPQYKRQLLTAIKGEIDSNQVTVEDFNLLFLSMDRASSQKIKKETQVLNDTLSQMDLIDICRARYLKEVEYLFFSCVHGTFSRIDNTLNHKANSSKLKKKKKKSYQASFPTTTL